MFPFDDVIMSTNGPWPIYYLCAGSTLRLVWFRDGFDPIQSHIRLLPLSKTAGVVCIRSEVILVETLRWTVCPWYSGLLQRNWEIIWLNLWQRSAVENIIPGNTVCRSIIICFAIIMGTVGVFECWIFYYSSASHNMKSRQTFDLCSWTLAFQFGLDILYEALRHSSIYHRYNICSKPC